MPIGTSLAIGLAALSAGGAVASAALGSRAAGKASKVQAAAGTRAAELQAQSAREALDFQREQFYTGQANFAPWLGVGQGALANLSNLMGIQAPQAQQAPQAGPATATVGGATPLPGRTIPMMRPVGGQGRWEMEADNERGSGSDFGGDDAYNRAYFGDEPGAINQQGADATTASRAMVGQPQIPALGPRRTTTSLTPQGGTDHLGGLVNPALGQPGALMQDFGREFEAPTDVTMQNDPGFQFRLQEGIDALQNSAAARGGLLTGATAEALTRYGQDYASGEYDKVYGRALGEYQQAYNIFEQNQAKKFNRLASMSGMGQTAAGQLSSAGQAAAGNVGGILMSSAGQIGNSLQNAAAARASGYVDRASQWGGALQGGTSGLIDMILLSKLGKR